MNLAAVKVRNQWSLTTRKILDETEDIFENRVRGHGLGSCKCRLL